MMLFVEPIITPIKNYYPLNTLSEDELKYKLQQCRDKHASIEAKLLSNQLHGDKFVQAKEDQQWLEEQIWWLHHLLTTIPKDKI